MEFYRIPMLSFGLIIPFPSYRIVILQILPFCRFYQFYQFTILPFLPFLPFYNYPRDYRFTISPYYRATWLPFTPPPNRRFFHFYRIYRFAVLPLLPFLSFLRFPDFTIFAIRPFYHFANLSYWRFTLPDSCLSVSEAPDPGCSGDPVILPDT